MTVNETINLLISTVIGTITSNGAKEITGEVHRTTLIEILNGLRDLLNAPDDYLLNQFPAWQPEVTYEGGTDYVVRHEGKIWAFVHADDQTGVEPGTTVNVWYPISALSLAHLRNRDIYLDFGGNNQVSAQEIREHLDNPPEGGGGSGSYPCVAGEWVSKTLGLSTHAWSIATDNNGTWIGVTHANEGKFFRSIDDGLTWTIITVPEKSWQSINYGNGVWVAKNYGGSEEYRSTDGGLTWSSITTAPYGYWYALETDGNGVWIAISYAAAPYLMRSTDDGLTWTEITVSASSWHSLATDGNGVWVAVAYGGADRLMRSTDNGLTWTNVSVVNNTWQYIAYSNGVWIAVSSSGADRLMRSTDDGATWSYITVDTTHQWGCIGTNGSEKWIVLPVSGALALISEDDGLTWSTTSIPSGKYRDVKVSTSGVWIAISRNDVIAMIRMQDTCPPKPVLEDGSIPLTNPQTGVPGTDPNHLATVSQLSAAGQDAVQVAEKIVSMATVWASNFRYNDADADVDIPLQGQIIFNSPLVAGVVRNDTITKVKFDTSGSHYYGNWNTADWGGTTGSRNLTDFVKTGDIVVLQVLQANNGTPQPSRAVYQIDSITYQASGSYYDLDVSFLYGEAFDLPVEDPGNNYRVGIGFLPGRGTGGGGISQSEFDTGDVSLSKFEGYIYGDSAPVTGDIILKTTSSILGGSALIFHNDSVIPEIETNWQKNQHGEYVVDTLNEIYIVKTGTNKITITIAQPVITPEVVTTQLSTPQNLDGQFLTTTSRKVVWDAVNNADNYILERDTDINFSAPTQIYSGSLLEYDDTGLTAGTTYYYRVKAQDTSATYTESNWAEKRVSTIALWEDDFPGTSLDTVSNWVYTSVGEGTITVANSILDYVRSNPGTTFDETITTQRDIQNDETVGFNDFIVDYPADAVGVNDACGLWIDSNNHFVIQSAATGPSVPPVDNNWRVRAKLGGTVIYDERTTILRTFSHVRIIRSSGNVIAEYWDGSSWIEFANLSSQGTPWTSAVCKAVVYGRNGFQIDKVTIADTNYTTVEP